MKGENFKIRHHFVIEFKGEEGKKKLVQIVLKLLKEHEIGNYYIEEKDGFETNKIIYNNHVIACEDMSNFDNIEKEFLKYL